MLKLFSDVWVSYPHHLAKHNNLIFYKAGDFESGVVGSFHQHKPRKPIMIGSSVVSIDEGGFVGVWNKNGQLLNNFRTPHVGFYLKPFQKRSFIIVDFNRKLGLATLDRYVGNFDQTAFNFPKHDFLSLWDYIVLEILEDK